jgi:peptidoglycan/xylan/chitin deacetylase (PgdA/CDA1 family)
LRELAADGVEIGCHTDTHPILSRLHDGEQRDREIAGAKEVIERRLGFAVKHFCYPNGTPADIDDAAVASVRKAGFASSVTCSFGLNTLHVDPLRILRVPLDSQLDFTYSKELLAGLHM